MKFTINKTTNVRKAFNDDGKCVAVFGVAADLLKANFLLEVQKGFEHNIIVVKAYSFEITEHSSIEAAKNFLKNCENL